MTRQSDDTSEAHRNLSQHSQAKKRSHWKAERRSRFKTPTQIREISIPYSLKRSQKNIWLLFFRPKTARHFKPDAPHSLNLRVPWGCGGCGPTQTSQGWSCQGSHTWAQRGFVVVFKTVFQKSSTWFCIARRELATNLAFPLSVV